jgi:DNA-binding transcriptional regulator YbjK
MASPVRPSQDRSRARRDALLRAAIDLLAEGGPRAVTHRAVATQAGVPLASTTYYFESIQQLTDEALRLHMEQRVLELREIAALAAAGEATVAAVAGRFVEALMDRDQRATIAQFEVYLEAARNPDLQASVAAALDESENLAVGILTVLGARDPQGAAASFVALVNGFAMHGLARPKPTDAKNLLEAIRALFIVQLMTDKQLAGYLSRLERPLDGTQNL